MKLFLSTCSFKSVFSTFILLILKLLPLNPFYRYHLLHFILSIGFTYDSYFLIHCLVYFIHFSSLREADV